MLAVAQALNEIESPALLSFHYGGGEKDSKWSRKQLPYGMSSGM